MSLKMEKRNHLNLQRRVKTQTTTSVSWRNQLREISTVLECYCGKEGNRTNSVSAAARRTSAFIPEDPQEHCGNDSRYY